MLRVFPILFLVTAALGCGAERGAMRDVAVLHHLPLHAFSGQEVDAYLRWLSEQPLEPVERVVLLARKNIGQPYRLFLLGEHPFELYDPDPMYCLSASDCVTFVEQTYAMALSHDWPSFFRTLQRIRYKNGEIGMLTRNHFTEADWNINNAWLFEDVTEQLAGGAVAPLHVLVDRAAFFAKHHIGQDIAVQAFEGNYLPRERLHIALGEMRDGDVVQIVGGDTDAQYVTHIGLVMHDEHGGITILHSTRPVVREEPLLEYISGHAGIVGLKFLRMRRCAAELPHEED